MKFKLRISGIDYNKIKTHLFPEDGLEAIAFAICGRHQVNKIDIFLVSKIILVPYEVCKRTSNSITWNSDILVPYLDEAKRKHQAILKFHSHPAGYENFSEHDNQSDIDTFSSIRNWLDDNTAHGSIVMLPDGRMFGRAICQLAKIVPISSISVAGDDISFWHSTLDNAFPGGIYDSQLQLFGKGTIEKLSKLKIGIVGCSGTGSIVLELLARLGVKQIVLIDNDKIEERNLNRIVNSKKNDIGKPKVEILANAVSL